MNDYVFNVKCNHKHSVLEHLIRNLDTSQETSRTALLERFIETANDVEDWMEIYPMLSAIEWSVDVPELTTWQAKCSEDALRKVRNSIEKDLKKGGVITKVLQSQFFLQLLMAAYLEELKRRRVSVKTKCIDEADITIPQMAELFTELILTDRNSDAILKIRDILVDWRNGR